MTPDATPTPTPAPTETPDGSLAPTATSGGDEETPPNLLADASGTTPIAGDGLEIAGSGLWPLLLLLLLALVLASAAVYRQYGL